MKKLYILIVSLSMILLTGCMKAYPLSDTQTDVVSEYMAGLILKYDKFYTPSLLSYDEVNEDKIDVHSKEKNEEKEQTEDTVDIVNKEGNIIDAGTDSGNNTSLEDNYTLADIIGDSGFDIQYKGFKVADTYPEDETNHLFSVDPSEGNQLLVLNFSIENKSDKDQTIDLSKANIKYYLNINDEETIKPLLVLLENNLQYIKLDIKAKKTIPSVLIFEVAKDMDLFNMILTVSKNSMTTVIDVE